MTIQNESLKETEKRKEICLGEETELKSDIKKLKDLLTLKSEYKNISESYYESIPSVEEIKSDLDYLQEYKALQLYNENQLKNVDKCIENIDTCSMIKSLRINLEEQQNKLSNMEKIQIDCDSD